MNEGILDNPELPLKEFYVPPRAIPEHINPVYEYLESAAKRAVHLFTTQKALLDPLLGDLDLHAKDDRRARDMYTVPDSQGRWVYMHQHPAFEEDLAYAQEDLRRAVRILVTTRPEDARYLGLVRRSLSRLDKEGQQEILAVFTRQRSPMSFMLGLIEGQSRKKWWEGYLGFADEGRTDEMQEEADRYMRLGEERGGKRFTEFAKETMMRFEYAGVMAGRLGSRRVSAKNLRADGDDHVRMTIYSGPFSIRHRELQDNARKYMTTEMLSSYDGLVRFLSAHEFSHIEDDPGEGKAGELTQPVRESAANFSAIDLIARDAKSGSISEEDLLEGVKGAIEFSLGDCSYLLETGGPLPDGLTLARHSVYDVGSSILLFRWLSSGGLQVEDGKITAIDLHRIVQETKDLYEQQSVLNADGSYTQVLRHFSNQLPIGRPFTLYAMASNGQQNRIPA